VGAWVALLLPGTAVACAVCGAGVDRTRNAFFETTVMLSLLPLGMIAGGLWWLGRRGRAFLADELRDRDEAQ
jgi:hypothetical protein